MGHFTNFEQWMRKKITAVVASPAAESPSGGALRPPQPHSMTPAPDQPDGLSVQFPEKEKPDVYGSISGNRPIPTASWLERKRIDREAFEKKWDIELG
jgi:hypothetical protein